MALLTTHSARVILLATAVYFAACGLSAIFYPISWLWISGLSTSVSTELGLTFGVIGAYLLSLSCGALIAWRDPFRNTGLIVTLLAANVLDFMVTLRAIMNHWLPQWNGIAFLVVTVVLSTLLTLAWTAARKGVPTPADG